MINWKSNCTELKKKKTQKRNNIKKWKLWLVIQLDNISITRWGATNNILNTQHQQYHTQQELGSNRTLAVAKSMCIMWTFILTYYSLFIFKIFYTYFGHFCLKEKFWTHILYKLNLILFFLTISKSICDCVWCMHWLSPLTHCEDGALCWGVFLPGCFGLTESHAFPGRAVRRHSIQHAHNQAVN